jgi:hypothetical protein
LFEAFLHPILEEKRELRVVRYTHLIVYKVEDTLQKISLVIGVASLLPVHDPVGGADRVQV